MSEDIFNEENKVSSSFFKHKEVGDKIQGTYVGHSEKSDNYKPGKMQQIYELLQEDGSIALIGGKVGIDRQMKNVKLGQIVGMEFVKIIPPKSVGLNPTHVIQVFVNTNVVNEEWLKDHNELKPVEDTVEVEDKDKIIVEDINEAADKAEAKKDKEAMEAVAGAPDKETKKLNKIGELAKKKLGVDKVEEVEKAVMTETKLAFLPDNYDKIIELLEAK